MMGFLSERKMRREGRRHGRYDQSDREKGNVFLQLKS